MLGVCPVVGLALESIGATTKIETTSIFRLRHAVSHLPGENWGNHGYESSDEHEHCAADKQVAAKRRAAERSQTLSFARQPPAVSLGFDWVYLFSFV